MNGHYGFGASTRQPACSSIARNKAISRTTVGDQACDLLESYDGTNDFIADVARRFRSNGRVSIRQATAVLAAHQRDNDRKARNEQLRKDDADLAAISAALAPGRQGITGDVVAATWKYTDFGYVLKLMIKFDVNTKVYGNASTALIKRIKDELIAKATPAAPVKVNGLCPDCLEVDCTCIQDLDVPYITDEDVAKALVGQTLTFTATVTPSDDNPAFGFFSRMHIKEA